MAPISLLLMEFNFLLLLYMLEFGILITILNHGHGSLSLTYMLKFVILLLAHVVEFDRITGFSYRFLLLCHY